MQACLASVVCIPFPPVEEIYTSFLSRQRRILQSERTNGDHTQEANHGRVASTGVASLLSRGCRFGGSLGGSLRGRCLGLVGGTGRCTRVAGGGGVCSLLLAIESKQAQDS